MKFLPTGKGPAQLMCIGSVEDVIAGRVREDLKQEKHRASDYQFGFELASPHSLQSMGESVLVNNYCYTTSTDKNDHYLKTISDDTFYTSGIFLVPKTAEPQYHLAPEKIAGGISFETFTQEIHAKMGAPCLLVALVVFKKLNATYIQKAPIYDENIFDHKNTYYGDLKLSFENAPCFFVSAMANFKSDSPEILKQLGCVLYHNPFDLSDALNVHTHGLVLNRKINAPNQLLPSDVTHTLHFYAEESELSEIVWAEIFGINSIQMK